MSPVADLAVQSFVLVPLGGRTIALHAESVIELVAAGKLQHFPHQTPWVSGAIVRRGRVVPVCDVPLLFHESVSSSHRLYLIAEWSAGDKRDWCAIPVAGECELATAENILPIADGQNAPSSSAVTGFLPAGASGGRQIEIFDLGALLRQQRLDAPAVERAS